MSGEARTGLMSTVNGGSSSVGVERGGMTTMEGERKRVDKLPGWGKCRTRDLCNSARTESRTNQAQQISY